MKRMLQIGMAVIMLAGLWPASSSGKQVQAGACCTHDQTPAPNNWRSSSMILAIK